MVSVWIESPFEMVICPSLQLINAFVVSKQGLPKITGWPLVGSFEWMTVSTMTSFGLVNNPNLK
jgi:hypothetical protein